MTGPEFVCLNDQAVRLASIRRDEATGAITLVLITRGSGDRDQITRLLESRPLTLRIPDEGEVPVTVRDVDLRSSGEGPQAYYRFSITLVPEDTSAHEGATQQPSIEDRLTSLEQRMDQIVALLQEIKTGRS